MPSLVQTNDLEADCTEMEAHALLSNITNSFLILNGPKTNESLMKSANGTLEMYYKQNMDIANVRSEHDSKYFQFYQITNSYEDTKIVISDNIIECYEQGIKSVLSWFQVVQLRVKLG